jgi:antitoxin HicB
MKVYVNINYDSQYGGFVADCPSLPGCVSQGKTKKEALINIQEALLGYIKTLRKHHKSLYLTAVGSTFVEIAV